MSAKPFPVLRALRCCPKHSGLEVQEVDANAPDALPGRETTLLLDGGEARVRLRGLGWDMAHLCEVLHTYDRAFEDGEACGKADLQRKLRALLGAVGAEASER